MQDPQLSQCLARFVEQRDPQAISELFVATCSELWDQAVELTGDAALADEALQRAFAAVIDSADRYDRKRSARAWLAGIVARCARRARESAPRTLGSVRAEPRGPVLVTGPAEGDAAATPGPGPVPLVQRRSAEAEVERVLAEQPYAYRPVLELALYQGLSSVAIAQRLGRTPGTVRTQLGTGLERMRSALPAGVIVPAALLRAESIGFEALRGAVTRYATRRARQRGALDVSSQPGLGALGGFAALAACLAVVAGGKWLGTEELEVKQVEARRGELGADISPGDDALEVRVQLETSAERARVYFDGRTESVASGPGAEGRRKSRGLPLWPSANELPAHRARRERAWVVASAPALPSALAVLAIEGEALALSGAGARLWIGLRDETLVELPLGRERAPVRWSGRLELGRGEAGELCVELRGAARCEVVLHARPGR